MREVPGSIPGLARFFPFFMLLARFEIVTDDIEGDKQFVSSLQVLSVAPVLQGRSPL